MLSTPKWPLVQIGMCEAASQLLFMYGAAHLPGVLIPLINQTYLVWNLAFASLMLNTRCGGDLLVPRQLNYSNFARAALVCLSPLTE